MPEERRSRPISEWQEGDAISGFALLSRKELRQDRNGRDYLDLELVDASGSISAKAWSDSAALEGDFEAPGFVAFRGDVRRFRDHLQINLQDCRRVSEEDRDYGFDETLLVPSTAEDIDDLWARLEAVLARSLRRPALQRLAGETLSVHGGALREHPAAKTIHHAYRGGLLEHVVSMAELAERVCDHYPQIDRDLVLLGVLFHDLGKLHEIGAMPANDYTLAGRLVGHVTIGRDLLLERCAAIDGFPEELRLLLEHLVLSHQGRLEYGSPVVPKTAEAFVLHFLDDLDSKLNQIEAARRRPEPFPYVRALGRSLYLEGDGGAATEPPAAAPAEARAASEPAAPASEPSDAAEPPAPVAQASLLDE